MNTLRTGLLMAGLTGLFLVVGFLVGGQAGMLLAFLFAAATNLFAYWNSDKVLLRVYGARQVDETSAPALTHLVRQLAVVRAQPPDPFGVAGQVCLGERDQPGARLGGLPGEIDGAVHRPGKVEQDGRVLHHRDQVLSCPGGAFVGTRLATWFRFRHSSS